MALARAYQQLQVCGVCCVPLWGLVCRVGCSDGYVPVAGVWRAAS
jgi:hypothetical protein